MKSLKVIAFLFVSLCMGACDPIQFMGADAAENYVERFYITAADDANNRSPVPLDVVLTHNPMVIEKLGQLTAGEYFRQRKQLLRDFPNQMLIASWEIVPGQTIDEVLHEDTSKVYAAYLFADFQSPGAHRALLPKAQTFMVHLARSDFVIKPA